MTHGWLLMVSCVYGGTPDENPPADSVSQEAAQLGDKLETLQAFIKLHHKVKIDPEVAREIPLCTTKPNGKKVCPEVPVCSGNDRETLCEVKKEGDDG